MRVDFEEIIAQEQADWLVGAVATATQDRRLLEGEPEEDKVLTEAIRENAKKAVLAALKHTHDEEEG